MTHCYLEYRFQGDGRDLCYKSEKYARKINQQQKVRLFCVYLS